MKKLLLSLVLFFVSFSAYAELTPAQQTILRNAVKAEPTMQTAITTRDSTVLVAWFNEVNVTPFYVWKTSVSTSDIYDNITWANFTPSDTPDGTQIWANRSLACQGKQFNLQTILVGRDSVNPTKSNIRSGLQDALTGIPSGASGATKSGGWNNVQAIMYRNTTRAEQLLSTGTGTTGSPALMGFEGSISQNDVSVILWNDDGTPK